ncbi:MAG: N-acetylmuramoyl-L-alanine amidase [Myxococcales bacterium]|nr:N-acetylmuramoyl-L-alanine amidase [Myxococcales bacterium]
MVLHQIIALLFQSGDTCLAEQQDVGPRLPPVAGRLAPAPTEPDAGVRRVRAGRRDERNILGAPKFGTLMGKTVYLSAGHGWFFHSSDWWTTQRGNSWGLIEDLISTEVISQHLIAELQRMGAYVVPIRESDPSPAMVIVDDEDPGFFMSDDWQTDALAAGWATPIMPLQGELNPFELGGSKRFLARSFGKYASWTVNAPADGEFNVYVSWTQELNAAPDAHYVVRHAGGETHYLVDQRRHGGTWVLLGRHFFRKDAPAEVRLIADSADESRTITGDAVRLGGGSARIERNGSTSGAPAFEEAARYNTQFLGAPIEVWNARSTDQTSDVVSRPRFAAWDHEYGEDAVYVAWHTNAPEGPEGTQSFAYGTQSYKPIEQATGVPGSIELASLIHDELVADLRAGWDSQWGDLKKYTGNFGELNPDHNDEMPSALIEVAFHATEADANALREPAFRRIAARAMAQGIAKYFAQKDGRTLELPPEPPSALRIVTSEGLTYLSWQPPADAPGGGDAAYAYRVYLSRDGYAFNDGEETAAYNFDLTDQLASGPVYVRVAAVNDGGESRPSPVLGAYSYDPSFVPAAGAGLRRALVVYGYNRLDAAQARRVDYASRDLDVVDRLDEPAINNGSYVARLGAALTQLDEPFDSATLDAVTSGEVALAGYETVIWLAGDDGDAMLADSRVLLGLYLDAGGHVIVSGSTLAQQLSRMSPSMLARFGVAYAAGAETADIASGSTDYIGWTDLVEVDVRDTSWGAHQSGAMDWIKGNGAGRGVMRYQGGVAAVAVPGASVFFSFPLENVKGDEARAAVLFHALGAVRLTDGKLPETPNGCLSCDGGRTPGGFSWILSGVVLLLLTTARRRPKMRRYVK